LNIAMLDAQKRERLGFPPKWIASEADPGKRCPV
jgi:hypothetical protein